MADSEVQDSPRIFYCKRVTSCTRHSNKVCLSKESFLLHQTANPIPSSLQQLAVSLANHHRSLPHSSLLPTTFWVSCKEENGRGEVSERSKRRILAPKKSWIWRRRGDAASKHSSGRWGRRRRRRATKVDKWKGRRRIRGNKQSGGGRERGGTGKGT